MQMNQLSHVIRRSQWTMNSQRTKKEASMYAVILQCYSDFFQCAKGISTQIQGRTQYCLNLSSITV